MVLLLVVRLAVPALNNMNEPPRLISRKGNAGLPAGFPLLCFDMQLPNAGSVRPCHTFPPFPLLSCCLENHGPLGKALARLHSQQLLSHQAWTNQQSMSEAGIPMLQPRQTIEERCFCRESACEWRHLGERGKRHLCGLISWLDGECNFAPQNGTGPLQSLVLRPLLIEDAGS